MRRISISAIVVLASVFAAASSAAAQDLGEAARLERERKANLTHHAPVITNEDLGRDRIVTPRIETPVVVETAPVPSTPTTQPAAAVASQAPVSHPAMQPITPGPGDPGFSLGEYARKVREERAARLAAEEKQNATVLAAAPSPAASAPPAPVRKAPPAVAASRMVTLPPMPAPQPRMEARRESRDAKVTKDVSDRENVQVRRGDSLWRISRLHLGHGHLWPLVWKSNPHIVKPGLIRVGETLHLPSPEVVAAALANESVTRVASTQHSQKLEMSSRASLASLKGVSKLASRQVGNAPAPRIGLHSVDAAAQAPVSTAVAVLPVTLRNTASLHPLPQVSARKTPPLPDRNRD